jgi:aminoglycoside 3-N-acetyltransferase
MSDAVTRQDIVRGLRELGVREGDILMIHSALSSLGRVEGGSDAVIDALIEAVGPDGTIAMPTLYLPSIVSGEVFDVDESPSMMGEITEVFRKQPGVVRSVHPTHPTAAYGARAHDLIRDHAKAPTACGDGTPFDRLAQWGGKVLLMGVDQDRNTLLHAAEDYADCPFLTDRTARYRDPADGEVKTITLAKFPGPHRNFIGLDPLFRQAGVMTTGKIGKAVCRLMDAAETVRIATEALKRDPSAVLCDNPECADCVRQRGAIRRSMLGREDFTLAMRIDEAPDLMVLAKELWGYGIKGVEIGSRWLKQILGEGIDQSAKAITEAGFGVTSIDVTGIKSPAKAISFAKKAGCKTLVTTATGSVQLQNLIDAASASGMTLLVRNCKGTHVDTSASASTLKGSGALLAFDPAEFAAMREMPFLSVYYHGIPKSLVRQLYVRDATFDGRPTEPGMGNGEVKELISILRCRSFDGTMVIWPTDSIAASCEAFWKLMESL